MTTIHPHFMSRLVACLGAALGACAMQAHAAPTCYPDYGPPDSKPNKFYLYFPIADDPTFPAYATLVSPLRTFEITSLPNPPAGTTAALRDAVFDVVATDYCEFSVDVHNTTSNPDALASPPARRNMVGIGSDANGDATGVLFGQAEAVDVGDAHAIDHARVWSGSYGVFCGVSGGALDGAGNTLNRWAYAIGGTAAHEGGHNYGLSHGDGAIVRPGEDALTNHIMPAGSLVSCEQRVSQRRHFNDTDFGTLANNVGLRLQTLTNWDFVNPNAQTAFALRLTVLSKSTSLWPVSPWLGSWNPWNVPSVTGPFGSRVFKGQTYNIFQVTWSTPKAWSSKNMPGSIAGQVRGAEEFHVGTNLSGTSLDPTVIIVDSELLDGSGNPLSLHPRTPTYNQGSILADGTFDLRIYNVLPVPLLLRNWRAWVLPRPLGIDALARSASGQIDFVAADGLAVQPWRQLQLPNIAELPPGSAEQPSEVGFQLGNLFKDGHNIRIVQGRGGARDAVGTGEVNPDVAGAIYTDPFPGSNVFLAGELVEPNALRWDPQLNAYVRGDLVTQVFLQVAGQRVKPVIGQMVGLVAGAKVTCSNLNTRRSVSLTPAVPPNGGAQQLDCESAGLAMTHGDRVQVTQVGRVGGQLPAVQLAGLDIARVVCTNLNDRKSVSFKPESSLATIDCGKAGLAIRSEQIVQIDEIGTVR